MADINPRMLEEKRHKDEYLRARKSKLLVRPVPPPAKVGLIWIPDAHQDIRHLWKEVISVGSDPLFDGIKQGDFVIVRDYPDRAFSWGGERVEFFGVVDVIATTDRPTEGSW